MSLRSSRTKRELKGNLTYLYQAWNTQEATGEIFDIDQATVQRTIDMHIAKSDEMHNDFKPLIYNIWNIPRQDHRMPQDTILFRIYI